MADLPHKPSAYRFEIVRHMIRELGKPINSPEVVRDYFAFMANYDREYIIRVDLNNVHEMIGYEVVGIGTDDAASVGPKEVFRGALLSGASCIILVHNHPSGHTTPSHEDHENAVKLKRLGDELTLQLLDFVIIGCSGRFYSFAEDRWAKNDTKVRTGTQAAESQHD